MSLLNDLMNKIQAIAETENVEHVTKVKLKLGALAHISSDRLSKLLLKLIMFVEAPSIVIETPASVFFTRPCKLFSSANL